MMPSQGFIYIIRAEAGVYKIGWAIDPVDRMRQLQTGNHRRLELVGTIPGTVLDEKALHRELKTFRLHGEWFQLSDEQIEILCTCQPPGPRPVEPDPQVLRVKFWSEIWDRIDWDDIEQEIISGKQSLVDWMESWEAARIERERALDSVLHREAVGHAVDLDDWNERVAQWQRLTRADVLRGAKQLRPPTDEEVEQTRRTERATQPPQSGEPDGVLH